MCDANREKMLEEGLGVVGGEKLLPISVLLLFFVAVNRLLPEGTHALLTGDGGSKTEYTYLCMILILLLSASFLCCSICL